MTPWLSIVIVNWNAAATLRRCLDSLRVDSLRVDPPRRDAPRPGAVPDVEVVVVDNGSKDDSLAVARAAWPQAVLVSLASNVGFAEGCNRGIAIAKGAWVLTLNNDTVVRPGFLETLRIAAASAADDVGMLQPRMLLEGREQLNSTGVLVHRDGSAHDRDFGAGLLARTESDEILCITAGAGLYRRAMLDATRVDGSYFDPTYFMYFEDVDLGWRCRLAGWRATYVASALVDHAFQGTSRRHGPHFVTEQCMRNRVRTLLKNASWRMIARSLPRSASDLLWLLQHAGGRALSDWLRAAWDGLRLRSAVSRIASIERVTVERRWVGPT